MTFSNKNSLRKTKMPRIGIKTTITSTAGGSFKVIMCNVGIRGDSLTSQPIQSSEILHFNLLSEKKRKKKLFSTCSHHHQWGKPWLHLFISAQLANFLAKVSIKELNPSLRMFLNCLQGWCEAAMNQSINWSINRVPNEEIPLPLPFGKLFRKLER